MRGKTIAMPMYHHRFHRQEPRLAPGRRDAFGAAAALCLCLIVALVVIAAACAHSAAGLRREQAVSQLASNTVAAATQVAPYLPAPAQPLVELLIALATAGLTAWNVSQHKRITALERNGANGQRRQAGPVAVTPPAAPP